MTEGADKRAGDGFWFIIKTMPNAELKAVDELHRAGFRAYVPKRAVYRRRRDEQLPIRRWPALIGYVFLRFPGPADWLAVHRCQGVRGILYVDGAPYRLPRREVARIMQAQRSMQYDAGNARTVRQAWIRGERNARRALAAERFQVGARVLDAATQIIARIVEITKRGTIKAIIEGKDRDMPVEFTDAEALRLIDDAAEAA